MFCGPAMIAAAVQSTQYDIITQSHAGPAGEHCQAPSQDFANGGGIHGSQLNLVPTYTSAPHPLEIFLSLVA